MIPEKMVKITSEGPFKGMIGILSFVSEPLIGKFTNIAINTETGWVDIDAGLVKFETFVIGAK